MSYKNEIRNVKVRRAGILRGELRFPGDKSLSHRAIIFGSLAEGLSYFTNVLSGEDCTCTRKAFEAMGVSIRAEDPTKLNISGQGLNSLRYYSGEIYLGNSGTSMRLLTGLLAGQKFESTLTGDPSLSSRPMKRVTNPLKQMGAKIEGPDDANFAPLRIYGSPLTGIEARLPIPSAQVKSALLLAGLYAQGTTTVIEPVKSRDHTERFLRYFGADIEDDGVRVSVRGGMPLQAKSFEIAGDISSAAFFMAIAALVPGAQIGFKSVLWNPTRTGIIDVLRRMGVQFEGESVHEQGPEPVCDFSITTYGLRAFEIRKEELPSLIDEIPILCVLATQAEGTSVIHDADELRVKETDRIHSMVVNLSKMGANIRAEGNTIYIQGPTPLKAAQVDSFKDHRTAMSLIVAGLIADGEQEVCDIECINTSFPTFFQLLKQLGVNVL